MILKNCKLENKIVDIKIQDGKIRKIGKFNEDGIDVQNHSIIPGLIDCHTHGCIGIDTMDGEFSEMSEFLAKNGVTSWLPTTMTVDMSAIRKVLNATIKTNGAQILGFHMEGPYLCKKYKGAHDERYIKNPNIDEFLSLPNIRMVTMAPELEGGMEFIKKCKSAVVSLGHTGCDYNLAIEAIENGANCVTHIFNAMPPLLHREPSLIGAALEKNIYTQIICDGFHIHKAAVLATYKLFGSAKMVLISDSMCATGMTDGQYALGGQVITVIDGVARTQYGAIAGSTSTLWQCVKKAVEFGIPFIDAVKMATKTPATMLGLNKGEIKEGFDADLLILDENLEIKNTIINGVEVYCS